MPTLKLSHSRKATLACIALCTALLAQTSKITPAEAKGHIGEQAVVCGSVASTKFAERSKGTPTFINLDRSYPDQIFTAVIWSEDRPKFGRPEEALLGKRICVSGEIGSYRGIPEIIVRAVNQIMVQSR
jgi:DNA/RNA endonuclease YhcR with UshA esterase domain